MRTTTGTMTTSWRSWHSPELPVQLGVSSCLVGDEVRFDGGHARDRFVDDVLGPWIEWVKVCPEVEVGMSTPRPSIRLVHTDGGVRLVEPASGRDHTDEMSEFARGRVAGLADQGLDGYVLKKNSPSCGLERLRVWSAEGMPRHKNGVGLFARELVRACPYLPVEEEGRLNDPKLRENFIERIFIRNRWRNLVRAGLDRRRLVEFHTAHKLLIWSHDEVGMRSLGRLLGSAGTIPDEELFRRYEDGLHGAVTHETTARKHVNVLQHAMGYLKRLLDGREKRELLTAIEDYRLGLLPLIVPVTLVRFNVRRHEIDYLLGQLYFDPHPKELLLRNHV